MNTTCQVDSLLLLSASERKHELQEALRKHFEIPVAVAASFREGMDELTVTQHRVVVVDEALSDLDPDGCKQFFQRGAEGFPIFVKLAISGAERCVQQVALGLRRYELEQKTLQAAVRNQMRAQLRDSLTTILVCGQLALKHAATSPDAVRNINAMVEAGEAMNAVLTDPLSEPEK